MLSLQLKPGLSQGDVMQSPTYWKALSFGKGNIKAFTMPYGFMVLSQMHIHLIFTIILLSWYFIIILLITIPTLDMRSVCPKSTQLIICRAKTYVHVLFLHYFITSLKEIWSIIHLPLLETSTIYMQTEYSKNLMIIRSC